MNPHAEPPAAAPRYARLLTALAHPVRVDMLHALDGTVATQTEIAARIGQPLPHVVHHMRRLVALGCVERVERRVRAGAVQIFYRRIEDPWFGHEDFEPFGPAPRKRLVEDSLAYAIDLVRRAVAAGAFADEADFDLRHETVELDSDGWEELDARLLEFNFETQRIVESVSRRQAADCAAPTCGTWAILLKFRTSLAAEAARRATPAPGERP